MYKRIEIERGDGAVFISLIVYFRFSWTSLCWVVSANFDLLGVFSVPGSNWISSSLECLIKPCPTWARINSELFILQGKSMYVFM